MGGRRAPWGRGSGEDEPAFGGGEFAPRSCGQVAERELTDADAEEAERGMADGRGHAADLAVAALDQFELEPAVGHILPEADGGIARWKDGLGIEKGHAAGSGAVVLDGDSVGEFVERFWGWDPFDLGPVGAWVAAFGIEEACVESGLVAEKQQSFGIGVEPAEGIDAGRESEPGEGTVW